MEGIASWAKGIVLAVIVVSILEMLLPNNKTQKYVKLVMGLFIIYNIISPLIKNDEVIKFTEVDLKDYNLNSTNFMEVNQESMDRRLEELYIEEIEKDIKKKVEKRGYIVKSCKVRAKITQKEENTGITKIVLKVEKNTDNKNEIKEEDYNESEKIEEKIVNEIQKIKKIDANISKKEDVNDNSIDMTDIRNLKKFLSKEYEVSEQCLKIN